MRNYRTTSHTTYDIKLHIVWITKYRKPILYGDKKLRVRELIRMICRESEVEIIRGYVSVDHIHLFVSVPPSVHISTLVQRLKGYTSHKLLMENKDLIKTYWGQHIWARGYCVVSSGNVTDEEIMKYIENQDKEQFVRDDHFEV